jgi:hypothetical protein
MYAGELGLQPHRADAHGQYLHGFEQLCLGV